MSQAPQRKDAQRNREAILCAARELFAERGDVPMYEVARLAGVGQATLYRNFPDRRNLVAALLEEHLERVEQLAAEHDGDPDAFFVLLRAIVETMASSHALGELAREDACQAMRSSGVDSALPNSSSNPSEPRRPRAPCDAT